MSSNAQTSHSFEWRTNRIVCNSWNGHADAPTQETLIHAWSYTDNDIPIPSGERMIFNLYLHSGDPPVGGMEDGVIVTSFTLDRQNECCYGRVGDANGLGGDTPTIGDVWVMIDAKFISGTCVGVIDCLAEADINQMARSVRPAMISRLVISRR